MTVGLNLIFLALAGLSILGALYYVTKAFGARSNVGRQAYNVGQVEAKRVTQVNWIRAAFLSVVAMIFIGVYAVSPLIARQAPEPDPSPTAPAAAPVEPTPQSAPTDEPALQPSPTGPPASPSPEVTAAPTPTTAPTTATVSSGVGVWLRGAPSTSGEQLEWLLDGTIVTLLAGQETADELVWQQVRTDAGVEGWVASDFLTVSEAETTP